MQLDLRVQFGRSSLRAQGLTDVNFQGRVQSTFNSLSGAMMMLFYFNMGYFGKHCDVAHLYFIEVAITLLAIIFLIRAKSSFNDKTHPQQTSHTCF